MKQLKTSVDQISQELNLLDKKEIDENGETSEKYKETRQEIVNVIKNIHGTTDQVSTILKKIAVYKKQMYLSQAELKQTRKDIEHTKKYLKNFANFLYKIENNLYSNTADQVDELKLLMQSDNIPQTLASDYVIKSTLMKFNVLMTELETTEKKNLLLIKRLNRLKINAKNQVRNYDTQLEKLQQKKNYLLQFMALYKNDTFRKSNGIGNLFDSIKDVYHAINSMVDDIEGEHYTVNFDMKDKLEKLKSMEDDLKEDTHPVAWPVYPVSYIHTYFGDQNFEKQYGVPHQGIQVAAAQGTPIYAARDGIIYHIVDNEDGIGINRVLMAHSNGYTSSYLYINKVLVSPGQVVRRGELIGYSGGEPGTKGAGFISKGANLTFGLFKDGIAVDPLKLLDLSVVKNKDVLPDPYHIRYLKDKYSRPIDITEVKFATGSSVLYRADSFLRSYGVGIYKEVAFREDAVKWTNVDRDVVICIAFAESTLGRHLTTSNNIGNVGNDDSWNRVWFNSALQGARLIAETLNNRHLGHYHTIKQLSRYGNKDGKIYASSTINRQTNVTKCLSQIKGYYVPEDYPFRIGPNPYRTPIKTENPNEIESPTKDKDTINNEN